MKRRELKIIKERLNKLEERADTIVKQAECSHTHTRFSLYTGWALLLNSGYYKECLDCGKTLEHFGTELEMLEAKLAHRVNDIEGINKRIDNATK